MPKSLEQLGQELSLAVENVPLDLIDPEPRNPNYIDNATLAALRHNIREHGFVQPVVLRQEGERYRLVDGEHRVSIVRELGYGTIPAVLVDADADEGLMQLLTTNGLRGEFVPVKVAFALADLVKTIPESEIRTRLGWDEARFRDTLRLAEFSADDVGEVIREQIKREAQDAPMVLRFVVNHRDAEVIERVVTSLTEGSKRDRGQALAFMCREFEKSKAKGKA